MSRKSIQCRTCGAYAYRLVFVNNGGEGGNRLETICNRCNSKTFFAVGRGVYTGRPRGHNKEE